MPSRPLRITAVEPLTGHYVAPERAGFSAAMRPEAIAGYAYPRGRYWVAERAHEEGAA
jgi:L-fuconate dehydratase